MQKTRPDWQEPIAVLGFGTEGQSTLRWLREWGFGDIRILDQTAPKAGLPQGISGVFGPQYLQGLEGVGTAIRSPGVRPLQPEIQEFLRRGGKLTSQVEAVFDRVGRERIIGVTGTLGKGTTCSLLAAMLEQGRISHRLAGNIGVPPLDVLDGWDAKAWLLLELSSFQLSTLSQSPHLAVVLKTTSEHLDWHASQAEYWDHKANLTRFQTSEDSCVFFEDTEGSAWIGSQGLGRKISIGHTGTVGLTPDAVLWSDRNLRLPLADTGLIGSFNLENLAAAATVALELGVDWDSIQVAARHFSPLEHRLEFVRSVEGIAYYNDSYATRPEASLGAVRALRDGPLGLILGGSEKFADFAELARGLAEEKQLQAVALIGQTASRLESELRGAGALAGKAMKTCDSLQEAVDFLRSEIASGAILLSPACASFGLFANYKERGKEFKRIVSALSLRK